MARTAAIGVQDFETIISNDYFYVDKTDFLREWWENGDSVTLITRPRRFGKTLNMSMTERFFSVKYAGQGKIFEKLNIWKEEKYRDLQGTYPVISLSFASVKGTRDFLGVRRMICRIIYEQYNDYKFLLNVDGLMDEAEKELFHAVSRDMEDDIAGMSLNMLSRLLMKYYGKKVIILLDEYDTPMHEAYTGGYWKEMVSFTRTLFNNTFKSNLYLERAVMTGITKISKESLFSDLNNLKVITMTSKKYASCFGFTEAEVFAAMDEFGMINKEEVKRWYDGFTIGDLKDIYNPWSIINLLDEGSLKTYWANTSSNELAGSLIRLGDVNLKMQFEELLSGSTIACKIDEEIVFHQLGQKRNAVWSLLLASGYLKVVGIRDDIYEMQLANYEVRKMFENMVSDWFGEDTVNYNGFLKALLRGDLEEMNEYMNRFSLAMFSSFDGGTHPSKEAAPERFYHGFVLGLLVDLAGRYKVTSNRESGLGRYDVMLKPLNKEDDGIILEFKIYNPKKEVDLEETVQAALKQIEEKRYEQELLDSGIKKNHIRKYGFAFEGKKILIGK